MVLETWDLTDIESQNNPVIYCEIQHAGHHLVLPERSIELDLFRIQFFKQADLVQCVGRLHAMSDLEILLEDFIKTLKIIAGVHLDALFFCAPGCRSVFLCKHHSPSGHCTSDVDLNCVQTMRIVI